MHQISIPWEIGNAGSQKSHVSRVAISCAGLVAAPPPRCLAILLLTGSQRGADEGDQPVPALPDIVSLHPTACALPDWLF